MKYRVFAEFLTPKEVSAKKVLRLLRRHEISIAMSFFPDSMNDAYARLIRACADAGVDFNLWPLMSDELGYFPNEKNAELYSDWILRVFDWAAKKKLSIPWLVVDLELPYGQARALQLASGLGRAREFVKIVRENRDRGRFYLASRIFQQLQEEVHARGARTLTPAAPHVVEDLVTGATTLQDIGETPVSTVQWDVVTFMNYTSMMTGYGKRYGVRPADARWYSYSIASDAKNTLWDRAGVALGVTWHGKFEDEPHYERPADLLPDIQAAKAALIEDIAIYNLEGILRSDRPEEWFETLHAAEPKAPPRSRRADAFRAAMQVVSRLG